MKLKRVLGIILVLAVSLITAVGCGGETTPTLTELKIVDGTVETTCNVGEQLDVSGLKVLATYDDGTTKELSVADGVTVTNVDTATAGEKTLTAAYGGLTAELKITVTEPQQPGPVEPTVTSVEIVEGTVATQILQGKTLDTSGIKLTVYYSNDTSKEIATGFTVGAFDTSVVGDQELTVTYEGKTAKITIEVVAPSLIKIEVVNGSILTSYTVGSDPYSIDGLKINAYYNNAPSTPVLVTEGFTTNFEDLDFTHRGTQELVITFGTKTCKVTITVTEITILDSIAYKENTTATKYYPGQSVVTDGLLAVATYSDATTEDVTPTVTHNVNTEVPGAYKITLSYTFEDSTGVKHTKDCEVDVTVVAIKSITLENVPAEIIIGETFVPRDVITVKVTYADEHVATVEGAELDKLVAEFDAAKEGTQTLKVTYRGAEATANIEVTPSVTPDTDGDDNLTDEDEF